MLRMKILIWTLCIMISSMAKGTQGFIGVNWGRKTSQTMIASAVVDMLMQTHVKDVKINSASDVVVDAFSNSNITLSISIREVKLKEINSTRHARNWIQNTVSKYIPKNITIRYMSIGAQPFSTKDLRSPTYRAANNVLELTSWALQDAGHDKIKATIPHFTDVFKPVKKPSDGEFAPEIKDFIIPTLRILQANNAPFMLNIYPLYSVKMMNWDLEFAFIDNKSNFTINDNGTIYNNIFEFWYDTCVWALRKAGAPNLKIVVGQIGWPTTGYSGANIENAQRFYGTFLPYIYKGKGTPLRPGPIDVYLHSLVDENKLSMTRGPFERHWGIYTFDGQPKFSVDLSGQGRDNIQASVLGVLRMPKRWCVYNGKNDTPALVNKWFDHACNRSDCSSIAYGGNCYHLDARSKISYAFNIHFQMGGQRYIRCMLDGLTSLVFNDPSVEGCSFPVEIMSADLVDEERKYRLSEEGASFKLQAPRIFLTLLLIFLVLV